MDNKAQDILLDHFKGNAIVWEFVILLIRLWHRLKKMQAIQCIW
jgi:hypothetical protein